MQQDLLTTAQVCEVLDIHPSTLGRRIQRGIAKPAPKWDAGWKRRFTRDEVQRLVKLRGEGRNQMPRSAAA